MQFVHSALTWGFLLALVPLLIHLINMMRHRRVKWAAMEFLLASYKKHRKWIWLKQLLLLFAELGGCVYKNSYNVSPSIVARSGAA